MARTTFAYYARQAGAHVEIRVFAGPDEQHRAHCGNLIMRSGEFNDWTDRLSGPGHTIVREDEIIDAR